MARAKFFKTPGGDIAIANPVALGLSIGLAIEMEKTGSLITTLFPGTFAIDLLQYLNLTPMELAEMPMHDVIFWGKLVAEKKREDLIEDYHNKWGVLISSIINSGYNIVRAWGAKIHTTVEPKDVYPFVQELIVDEKKKKEMEQKAVDTAVELGIPAPKVK